MKRLSILTAVLLLLPAASASAAFPGSNGTIAFEGEGAAIGTVNADGTRERFAVIDGKSSDRDPSWSGDGRRLAFTSSRDGNEEIYVLDADSGRQTRLTANPARDFDPSFTADGSRIVFASTRDGNPELYKMAADGRGPAQRLTFEPAVDQQPVWSFGDEIAFASARAGNLDIFVMDADGGTVRRVTSDPASEADPTWKPDGSRIAYTRGDFPFLDVFSADATGGDVRRLTTAIGADHFPSWSPDGTRIAFVSDRTYQPRTWVMGADGEAGAAAVLLASGVDPNWAPLPPPPPEGPEAGETVTVVPAAGTVTVAPGTRSPPSENAVAQARLTEPSEVPVRTSIDVTNGRVALKAATTGEQGEPIIGEAIVSQGVFTVTQADAAGAPPLFSVRGPRKRCRKAHGSVVADKRLIVIRANGRFSSRGSHGRANGRATQWTTHDRCKGTVYKVAEGIVEVVDRRLGITVLVPAGRCYLASATPYPGEGRAHRTCPRSRRGR